jgi:hypothetical protein
MYNILLDNKLIGTTRLEKADPPMGVVFGEVTFLDIDAPYNFLKAYCVKNNIDFDDYPEDRLISTRTIATLKIMNNKGREIKGIGNQICGIDSGKFELTVEGIPYPFYGDEFPHHVKDYQGKFS